MLPFRGEYVVVLTILCALDMAGLVTGSAGQVSKWVPTVGHPLVNQWQRRYLAGNGAAQLGTYHSIASRLRDVKRFQRRDHHHQPHHSEGWGWGWEDEEEEHDGVDVFNSAVAIKYLKLGKFLIFAKLLFLVVVLGVLVSVGIHFSPVALPFFAFPIALGALALFIPLFGLAFILVAFKSHFKGKKGHHHEGWGWGWGWPEPPHHHHEHHHVPHHPHGHDYGWGWGWPSPPIHRSFNASPVAPVLGEAETKTILTALQPEHKYYSKSWGYDKSSTLAPVVSL